MPRTPDPAIPDRPFASGDHATARLPEGTFTGVITGFNASGLSALIELTADAGPGYPAGREVPVPVRLLKAGAR